MMMRDKYQIAINVMRRYLDYDMVESPSLMRGSVPTEEELIELLNLLKEELDD